MTLQQFFEKAPQDPYIFAALVGLAVISAWQPLTRIARAARGFYLDVVHKGIRRAFIRIAEYTDRKADLIVNDPQFGTLRLLTDFHQSTTLAWNAIILTLIGIAVFTIAPEDPDLRGRLIKKLFGAVVLLAGILSVMVWSVDGLIQNSVMIKVRRKLRER